MVSSSHTTEMNTAAVTPGPDEVSSMTLEQHSEANDVNNFNHDRTVECENDDNQKLVRYCQFIVAKPTLSFVITLSLHIVMILLTVILVVSGYDILPIDFGRVPLELAKDPTKLRTDAWWYALEDDSIEQMSGGQLPRAIQYQVIQMVYEIKGGNVFTKENLLKIKENEDKFFNTTKYQTDLCLLQNISHRTCKKPLSILRFFDGSLKTLSPVFYDPDFKNISKVLYTATRNNVSNALLNYHLGKDAVLSSTAVSSDYTRSLMYIGWPFDGYTSTEDRKDEQRDKIKEIIVDTFGKALEEHYKDGIGKMNFYYNNNDLMVNAIVNQVTRDLMLAVASFIFIFLFMWLQTGSLWLTAFAVFSIISSFNITNLIYRIVFDYRYIGIFHVLSIFIILGIGADDVFVFMDTWKQSANNNYKSLAHRLSDVYRRACKAMLITSFTTMVAFLSNVSSPLLAISSFGLFSGVLVLVNYLSVILFFPTVVIVHHVSRRGRCCCAPLCCKKATPTESTTGLDDAQNESGNKGVSEKIIGFFGGWFHSNVITHKVVRWVVLFIFVAIIGTAIGFATQLEPSKEQVKLWQPNTNWAQIEELNANVFKKSQEDRVVVVSIIWGLKEQDRSNCHHTDFKCKGKTVLDTTFDLNPPPCQTAILEFCTDLKNLPRAKQESLRLRRSEITGEIETECVFERMNKYLEVESTKQRYPNNSNFMIPLNSNKMKTLMEHNPNLYNVSLLPDTYYRYFEVGTGYFITHGGSPTYASTYDFKKYGNYLAGGTDPTVAYNSTLPRNTYLQGNKYGHRLIYVAVAVNTTIAPSSLGYQEGLPIYEEWESFVTDKMEQMPSSCKSGFQATVSANNVWHWLKVQQVLVQTAFTGIIIGLVLALVILIVATTNVIVGVLATFTIGMITCSVLGIIVIIGWKLGPLESLNLTLVVGLAVDYVVHFAEGYMELRDETRSAKVKYTLSHVGISVLSGAFTTLGASIFMFAAKIIFFFQFGVFIFCTIGFSILFSLFFFVTILGLIGPEGETGSILPLTRRAKNMIRGKSKNDVNCKFCKGKGFHPEEVNEHVDKRPPASQQIVEKAPPVSEHFV